MELYLSSNREVSLWPVFPFPRFHRLGDDANRISKLGKRDGVNHGSIGGSGPIAISGYPRGHNVIIVTRCRSTQGRTSNQILSLEPSVSRIRSTTFPEVPPEKEGLFTRDAQAACRFNSWASKSTPFFQIVNAIAAILRAKVRRAMVGLIPLANRPA